MSTRRSRALRWLVPAAILAGTTGAAAAPNLLPAGAESVPVLPDLSPAQLLEKVRTTSVTTLSGDVTFTARLGLPDLSGFGFGGGSAATSLLGLLSGSHTLHVAVADAEHLRLALDGAHSESDWVRNGNDLWSWDSSTQQVRHLVLDADAAHHADGQGHDPAAADPTDAATPQAAADRLLAAVDPSTEVTVRTPGYVAGRPVYELVVTPRSVASTIADGVISVDATTGLPLAVRVDAKGATAPAFEVAFTSISYDQPAAGTFAFTPPPGAQVTEAANATDLMPFGSGGGGNHRHRRADGTAPNDTAPGAAGSNGTSPNGSATPSGPPGEAGRGGPGGSQPSVRTVGDAWDTVVIVSGVDISGMVRTLLDNAPAVTLADGSVAHLVSTRLVNALFLPDGRVAIGAVDSAALQAAVNGR